MPKIPKLPKVTEIPNIVKNYVNSLDVNQIVNDAMKVPGVKINREAFLRKELKKNYSEDIVEEAIKYNPAKAGIPRSAINVLAKNAIDFETNKVTALSAVASIPGGIAALGSATADIASYFAHILRIVQKLAYLYGFPDFQLNDDSIDEETLNYIFVFIGIMFGVQGATEVLSRIAEKVAENIAKKLPQKALTKGMIYPLFKKILTKIGMKVTKQTFADALASAVPVLGAILSGGLTYVTFKPRCKKLRDNLKRYNLSDPDFYIDIATES